MSDTLAGEQIERYEALAAERRALYESTWQSIAQYFAPSESSISNRKLPGNTADWTAEIYDTTAIHAGQVLSAGQRNWLTPSGEPWFSYEPPEFLTQPDREEERDDVANWLSNATQVIQRELARSNFYGMVNIDYDQVGIFGTGMLMAEEGKKSLFNFRQFKPWHLTIEEDDTGVVDSVHREFLLTTRQAVQQFGLENLGPLMQKAFSSGKDLSRKWKFLHACFPRADSKRFTARLKRGDQLPWASVYVAFDDKKVVEVGGYHEQPYLCSRFRSWGAPTCWGYSPAYLALADARQLNFVTQHTDALAELKAYPRMLYPDNLEGDVDLRAGGVTTYDSNIPGAKPEEWMTKADEGAALELMQRKEAAINRIFYVDMFTMLAQLQDKKMTAYEIAQRLGEKLEQFTPVFDRRVTEFLNPLLNRLFGIALRAGALGEPPASLWVPADGGRQMQFALPVVAITSRISQALKALQNQGIVNTLSVLQPLAQVVPDVLDNYDFDKLARELARNYGMDPALIRPLKAMGKIREARAQAAAAQQAADLAQRLSASASDLSKAPPPLRDAVVEQFTA